MFIGIRFRWCVLFRTARGPRAETGCPPRWENRAAKCSGRCSNPSRSAPTTGPPRRWRRRSSSPTSNRSVRSHQPSPMRTGFEPEGCRGVIFVLPHCQSPVLRGSRCLALHSRRASAHLPRQAHIDTFAKTAACHIGRKGNPASSTAALLGTGEVVLPDDAGRLRLCDHRSYNVALCRRSRRSAEA